MLTNYPGCSIAFVLCVAACVDQITSSDDVDTKRSWDMDRFGRGLQMLRLGKRNPDDPKDTSTTNTFSLSDEEMRRLVNILLGDSRDPTRRQPPLPRYGRDNMYGRRELVDLLPNFPNPIYVRPPPRGGRYKRSADASQDLTNAFTNRDIPYSRIRSVVRPRIGRYLQELHLQTKAISRPRIGREQLYGTSGQDGSRTIDVYQ